MARKDLLDLVDELDENSTVKEHDRYLVIDALNLFFRNFSAINAVNSDGAHIGGVGGFFRSLGSLVKNINPSHIYIIFDGIGGSNNRKNLIPEYKSGRNESRVTNWDVFDNLEEEDDSKISQIQRIAQYLKSLPVKTIALPKVEADDIIADISQKLTYKNDNKVFIVSSDQDYLQLITDNITVYRPMEKKFYTEETMWEKYNMPPENFILYKLLMGDGSDKIPGIKGLGEKKLPKLFPELSQRKLKLDDLLDISESKLKDHIIYARLLHDIDILEKRHKIMDLSVPMITEDDEKEIDKLIAAPTPKYHPDLFLRLYNADKLGNLIRNPEHWLHENFSRLK